MATSSISSRKNLSFTATSDAPGIKSNWSVPHAKDGYWGDTVPIGQRHFAEVAELASCNEKEAIAAIVFAITSPEWNHTPDGVGWGIEQGFSQELAEAAVIGLRAIREGFVTPADNAA